MDFTVKCTNRLNNHKIPICTARWVHLLSIYTHMLHKQLTIYLMLHIYMYNWQYMYDSLFYRQNRNCMNKTTPKYHPCEVILQLDICFPLLKKLKKYNKLFILKQTKGVFSHYVFSSKTINISSESMLPLTVVGFEDGSHAPSKCWASLCHHRLHFPSHILCVQIPRLLLSPRYPLSIIWILCSNTWHG